MPITDDNGQNVFGTLKNRASNALPTFSLASGFSNSREKTIVADNGRVTKNDSSQFSQNPADRSRAIETMEGSKSPLDRRRSNSSPADPTRYSLRQRAVNLKDSAWLDLRTRASNLELPKFAAFQFSLPFSDSSPSVTPTRDEWQSQHESDTFSLTSLEAESLTVRKKTENNRLRGLLEGLPRIGLPGSSAAEPAFAGLDRTKSTNIIVLGGYRGSILRSADDRRMLWIPVKVGLGIRKV